MRHSLYLFALTSAVLAAAPAMADDQTGDEGIEIKPIADIRLRYETADQDNALGTADAVTLRARGGVQAAVDGFSFLAEAEGTIEIVDDFNNTLPTDGVEPFSVVADPHNFELNRLQIGYKSGDTSLTVGRQRIIHPGARFLGNVGWRQNEQTFDAVRAKTKVGPLKLDATYAISQRTIFGEKSPNDAFDGDFILLRGDVDLAPVTIAPFVYSIDYDTRLAFSSATYGAEIAGVFAVGNGKIKARGIYAVQTDIGGNPADYSADYLNLELGGSLNGFGLTAGFEKLGSDGGVQAFQTPLATLHKFNGYADLFLVTPAAGLQDIYVTASKGFNVPALPGLKASVTYHQFDSDIGSIDYGNEINAALSFKVGKVGILAKYANYSAAGFGVDTQKFWLQAGISF